MEFIFYVCLVCLVIFGISLFVAGICLAVNKLKKKTGESSYSSRSSTKTTPEDDFNTSFAFDHTSKDEKVCPNCGFHSFTKTRLHYRCQRCAQTFSYYDYQNLSPYTGDHPELGIYNIYPKDVLDRCLSKFDKEYENKFHEKYHMTIEEYYNIVLDNQKQIYMPVAELMAPTDYKGKEQLSIYLFEDFILYEKNYPTLSGKGMIKITNPYAYLKDVYRPISCLKAYKEIGKVDKYNSVCIQVSFQGLSDLTYTNADIAVDKLPILERIRRKTNVKKESVEKEVKEFKRKYGIDWYTFSIQIFPGIHTLFAIGDSLANKDDLVNIKHYGKCFTAVPKSREQVFEKLLKDRVPNLKALKEFVYVDSDIINKAVKRDVFKQTIDHQPNFLDAALADAAFGTAGVAMYVATNSGSETRVRGVYDHLSVYLNGCPFIGFVLTKTDTPSVLDEGYEYFQGLEIARKDKQPSSTNNYSELIELKRLLDEGIITQEEFDAKKKEILKL